MIERYLHILTALLACSKEIKIDIYMQLLLTPLEIEKHNTRRCLCMVERYTEVARKYSENPTIENRVEMEEIIDELINLDSANY